jgi:hypothetical protein
VSGQLHALAALPRRKSPGAHSIWGWVGPRAGLDDVEKRKNLTLPGLEIWPLGRPAQSCYTDCAVPTPRRSAWRWEPLFTQARTVLGPILVCKGYRGCFSGSIAAIAPLSRTQCPRLECPLVLLVVHAQLVLCVNVGINYLNIIACNQGRLKPKFHNRRR